MGCRWLFVNGKFSAEESLYISFGSKNDWRKPQIGNKIKYASFVVLQTNLIDMQTIRKQIEKQY